MAASNGTSDHIAAVTEGNGAVCSFPVPPPSIAERSIMAPANWCGTCQMLEPKVHKEPEPVFVVAMGEQAMTRGAEEKTATDDDALTQWKKKKQKWDGMVAMQLPRDPVVYFTRHSKAALRFLRDMVFGRCDSMGPADCDAFQQTLDYGPLPPPVNEQRLRDWLLHSERRMTAALEWLRGE